MVPRLPRYYGAFRLPVVRLAALRCLRLAIPPMHRDFAPLGRRCAAGGSGELVFRFPSRKLRWRRRGLPGSWGTLMVIAHALRPRLDRPRPIGTKCGAIDAAPAYDHDEGSKHLSFSGLNHMAFDLAVYASRRGSPPSTQDSLPAAGPALPGGIGYPRGSNERFPSSSLFLLSQAFLAQGHSDL